VTKPQTPVQPELQVRVPQDCPEYVRCNAPICPLDKDWQKRTYDSSDSTCLFLRETMKEGAEQNLSVNPVFIQLHRICRQWIAEEQSAQVKYGVGGVPMGRAAHLKAILAAADSGSTLAARQASGQRLKAK
jgi:hypothetical protein